MKGRRKRALHKLRQDRIKSAEQEQEVPAEVEEVLTQPPVEEKENKQSFRRSFFKSKNEGE